MNTLGHLYDMLCDLHEATKVAEAAETVHFAGERSPEEYRVSSMALRAATQLRDNLRSQDIPKTFDPS